MRLIDPIWLLMALLFSVAKGLLLRNKFVGRTRQFRSATALLATNHQDLKLKDAVREFAEIFSCEETLNGCCAQLSENIRIDKSLMSIFTAAGAVQFPHPSEETLKKLYEQAQPASFGKGVEAVLDPAYRSARTLSPGDFAFNYRPDANFLNRIKALMLVNDDSDQIVRADLYRMNIYGPGDFFKEHKDTPQADGGHFGSLVLCLPTAFQGGVFVVRSKNGAELKYDWAADTARVERQEVAMPALSIATDLDHWIEPVTSGYRVTVTFHLYTENLSQVSLDPLLEEIKRTPAAQNLLTLSTTNATEDNTKPVLFPLSHQYSNQVAANNQLKGVDAGMFAILQEMGWQPKLRFYYHYVIPADEYIDDEDDDEDGEEESWYALTDQVDIANDWNVNSDTEIHNAMKYPSGRNSRIFLAKDVTWAIEPTDMTMKTLTVGVMYGNEPSLQEYKGNLCIEATYPPQTKEL